MTGTPPRRPEFADRYVDLAQPRLGAEVMAASDDFFAAKERLIDPADPVFVPGKYDDHGKWMDGWESRRKRTAGNDFCLVRICPGTIHGVDIDTSFFTGNYPPHASLDACHVSSVPDAHTEWQTLIPKTALSGDAHHFLPVNNARTWTHLRLNIYPDGGVARLRVYGVAYFNWNAVAQHAWTDLAAMQHGGRALACSDMHYGHMSNLIAPGQALNMGDGWETRRRREPGNDWVILKLGHAGRIRRVIVDTSWFKGNFPARCSLHGALLGAQAGAQIQDGPDEEIQASGSYWKPILPPVELAPDQILLFEEEVLHPGPVSHVRLDIYPDGGISRLRLLGEVSCP